LYSSSVKQVAFTGTVISSNAVKNIINANDTNAFLRFMIFSSPFSYLKQPAI
jgi:hypothetical protein